MYRIIIFNEVKAAQAFLRTGGIQALALMVRLRSGRLVEIDFGLAEEGGEITSAARSLMPASSSAVVVRDRDLQAVDERLERWEHAVYSL